MSIELIPKSNLPIWNKEDDKRKEEYERRLKLGKLCLVKY